MDRYKEINLEIILKNQNLLKLVSLYKQEIIKLNRNLLIEKQRTQFLKSQIAKIIADSSAKIVGALLNPEQSFINKTPNNSSKRISSTCALNERLSLNANQNCIIIQRSKTPQVNERQLGEDSENIRPRYSNKGEISPNRLKVFNNVTCRAEKRMNIYIERCDNVDDSNSENSASDVSCSNISVGAGDIEEDLDADILDEEPPTSSNEYPIRTMQPIIEKPDFLPEISEFNIRTIIDEPSRVVEDIENILASSEDQQQSSVTNCSIYSRMVSEAIGEQPVFQRNTGSNNTTTTKRTKSPKKDEMVPRRPKRNAAPTKLAEPSLIRKLRRP